MAGETRLSRTREGWIGRFEAMASPCEVQLRDVSRVLAQHVTDLVAEEAWRVEQRFSRYRDDNIIAQIRDANGKWVTLDDELERLLDYAHSCWQLSEGRFDITSGVLRRVWRFDGSDRIPSAEEVAQLLPLIGWDKVEREQGRLRMPAGMEVDLGGIGKEYAVDRALLLTRQHTSADLLINFGGDLVACAQKPWQVGIENLRNDGVVGQISLSQGAVATSGDTRRFLLRAGKRYSHILDPLSGWPIEGGPHSITVVAARCTEAGMLATLALLRGKDAEAFLQAQNVRYWGLWD
ncbi:MAG: FAD:protein FMN transferase [Alcanivoracaceae bacterium]|nr:FAD:protein FMN transferase [Alcanivoracaceae bacterium]